MFVLKGMFLESTQYISKKDNQPVKQAVVYSTGDGQTYRVSGVPNLDQYKSTQQVEFPVEVRVYNGSLFVSYRT